MKTKIGIVLSGGGARGIAHLGILKALEEFELCPLTFQEPAQER
jgi:NTE family protein